MAEIRLDLREAEGDLPAVCMACGRPATDTATKSLFWWPWWTYWFLLLHPFIWGVVALWASKRATLRSPLCKRHRHYWRNSSLLIWITGAALLLPAAGLYYFGVEIREDRVEQDAALAFVGGSVLICTWIAVIAILHCYTIRPYVITKTEMVLKGVSEAFVLAMQKADQERFDQTDEQPASTTGGAQRWSDAIQAPHDPPSSAFEK